MEEGFFGFSETGKNFVNTRVRQIDEGIKIAGGALGCSPREILGHIETADWLRAATEAAGGEGCK